MLKFAGRRARRYAGFVFSPPPPEAPLRPSGQEHRLFRPGQKAGKAASKIRMPRPNAAAVPLADKNLITIFAACF